MGVVCAALIGACSQPQPPAAAEPTQPLDTRPTEPPVADPSEPVASGNTPVAADIAAIAGLGAQFDPARDPADDLATAKVEAQRGKKRILIAAVETQMRLHLGKRQRLRLRRMNEGIGHGVSGD